MKIKAVGLTGEDENFPRVELPLYKKDVYLALSGGKVCIGNNNPSYTLGKISFTRSTK